MENVREQPGYYAIVPANVRYDDRLKANEKLLYGEITALSSANGICWASNGYFAKLYNVNKVTISNWINKLIKIGYISSELVYKENSKEIDKRILRISQNINTPINKNANTPINKNINTPINKNIKDNNTSINNTSINKEIKILSGSTEPDHLPYAEIVDYLNQNTGSKYRSSGAKTKKLIKSRFNEGFSLDDFKRVIDIKSAQWLKDQKMNKFLRPETLFGSKFESYLNERITSAATNKPVTDADWLRRS